MIQLANDIQTAREFVNELKAEQRTATKTLASLQVQLKETDDALIEWGKVQELFQTAVKVMYDNLSSRLGDIITEGISIVFPDSQYEFVVEFVERRNNVEADLYLRDSEGNMYNPVDAVGGGIIDFISLLLRITYIILSKYDSILIADEPLKFIDRGRIPEAAKFVKKVCEDFNFQLLMVSHIPELINEAEVVYKVTKESGNSSVQKIIN